MFINDVKNKEEICSVVIHELKDIGIKYRKEKKNKVGQMEKPSRKKIFRAHLHLLDLTDAILANGGIVQVPQFVSDACQRILEHVETEGLFRKAGSTARQKAIRADLEAGLPLGRSHHVIDVANLLKSFFRELPEPLLPHYIHEPLLRALLSNAGGKSAILMICLLLPPLIINTLAFFMQFLNTVSLSAHLNKMSADNLAILFRPGLMPVSEGSVVRFSNHEKVIQLLIENAEMIGIIPYNVLHKVELSYTTPLKDVEKKKKKRRSGSLTRMFNGLKKIVGAIGSAENLDNTLETVLVTPCLTKSAKKRKNSDASAFSAKKRKELLSLLPENGGLLPNTPCAKEVKKTRLSLGGRKNLKFISNTNLSSSIERRWSVVGPGWAKKKQNGLNSKKGPQVPVSPVISLPCIIPPDEQNCVEIGTNIGSKQEVYAENVSVIEDYVRIPKSEYEAIKERVSAIESRISQEFGNVNNSLLLSSLENESFSGPERVLNRFERTVEETESMSSPSTEQLAKKLSRELKIRRSDSTKIIRSPSARKIGTIRRRSKENVRLSRNKTWHVSDVKSPPILCSDIFPREDLNIKANLKRGRPNTIQTGLLYPASVEKIKAYETEKAKDSAHNESWTAAEVFFENKPIQNVSDLTDSFVATPIVKKQTNLCKINVSPMTPNNVPKNTDFITIINVDEEKTPMLPPRSAVKRSAQKTPMSHAKPIQKCIITVNSKTGQTPIQETQTGRASIARLRSQNAGMVMAKAKLFDGLGTENIAKSVKSTIPSRRNSTLVKTEEIGNPNKTKENRNLLKVQRNKTNENSSKTPRRKNMTKSPVCTQKRQRSYLAVKPNLSQSEQNKCIKAVNSPHTRHANIISVNSSKAVAKSKRPNLNSPQQPPKLQHAHTFSHRLSPRFQQNSNWKSPKLRYHSESVNF